MSKPLSKHRTKLTECPVCGTALNTAVNADGSSVEPQEGDLSVCCFCTTLMIFDEDVKCRVITDSELEMLKWVKPDLWDNISKIIKATEKHSGKPSDIINSK